jgi:nucleoside-diphosphate-sugar epimerase
VRILITGYRGFIGQHLTRELEEHGHSVFGVDMLSDPSDDLRLPGVAQRAVDRVMPGVVVHLAAKVGRMFGEDNPAETIADNAGMTALVAQAAATQGARVVYASTSEIYGDNGEVSCDELIGPFSLPHNIYGLSKMWGEDVCRLYAPRDLTILRFSMPYGPGLPAGRGRAAIINMLWQAKRRQRIPVHTGAERSWCFIGDTVRAARLAIEDWREGVYNVGRDDAAISMMRVARLACDLTDAPYTLIREVEAPARQTVVKRLATERIRMLGWEPRVDLQEGMEQTLEWVRTLGDDGLPKEDWWHEREAVS